MSERVIWSDGGRRLIDHGDGGLYILDQERGAAYTSAPDLRAMVAALDGEVSKAEATKPDTTAALVEALRRTQMMVCRNHCDRGEHHFNCKAAAEAITAHEEASR